jgi:hypothetical protein
MRAALSLLTVSLPAPTAVPNLYYYTSPKSQSKYVLNTTADTHANAEAACNLWGGHLAMWESLAEQSEVEQAFSSDGGLIGSYHFSYWAGLVAEDWPKYAWMDKTLPLPSTRSYTHWIKNAPANRAFACGLASWNASYTNAWGWQDADCERQMVYICEYSSGWRCRLLRALPLPALQPTHVLPQTGFSGR